MRRVSPWAAAGFCVLIAFGALPASGQSLDHDSSQPIEISADSLEVAQEEKIATFAGNVDAVQGDLVLSADKLMVHYEGESRSVGIAAGSGNTIRRIDAEGHVIIASPEETAEGERGTYDVPAKLVTLEGQVVLTRGQNVIRGERLELDLVSGKSRIVGTEASVAEDEDEVPGERVKALFTPKAKDDRSKEPPIPEARPQ
ncbi:MAG: lipopolysaccharide transport periplasmic protein LptA [Alphaproteobacteria bacterium]|nr:lipopolysaccharide transport periplasmic protein LptA [Alphaproteobacteria bacterium]